jgi:hypothetical protein
MPLKLSIFGFPAVSLTPSLFLYTALSMTVCIWFTAWSLRPFALCELWCHWNCPYMVPYGGIYTVCPYVHSDVFGGQWCSLKPSILDKTAMSLTSSVFRIQQCHWHLLPLVNSGVIGTVCPWCTAMSLTYSVVYDTASPEFIYGQGVKVLISRRFVRKYNYNIANVSVKMNKRNSIILNTSPSGLSWSWILNSA